MRLWGQMPDPRHSLHLLLWRSCSHICDPPHSLHMLFWRSWGQIPHFKPSTHYGFLKLWLSFIESQRCRNEMGGS
jgi:hypothetical protein